MNDLVVALGLVLVIEGLIWAIAPGIGAKMAIAAATTPPAMLRLAGLAAMALGVLLVSLVRG